MKKYTKRGENCEYTEDCMWGVDGWCDRPPENKCEIKKMDEAKETESKICTGGCIRNYADPLPHCDGCTFGERNEAE